MRRALYVVLLLIQISAFSQDLIVTNYSGPTTFSRYEEFLPDITIKNTGIVTISQEITTTAYLSADDQWQASDIRIADFYKYDIKPGESFTGRPLRARVDAAPGTYFLIIRVDDKSQSTETDEANNLLIISNVIVNSGDVDFTLTSFSLDKSIYTQNSLVKPSYILQNLGTTNTGGVIWIKFLFSTDATVSPDDRNLNIQAPILTGADNFPSASNLSMALPTVPNGNYYILASVDVHVDTNKRFEESNEGNNLFAIPITIQSSNVDLEITAVTNSYYYSYGGDVSISANISIRNNGTTSVAGYDLGAQLMPEGQYMPYSGYYPLPFVGEFEGNINPGEVKTFYVSHYLYQPNPGNYYVAFEVNFGRSVNETNTSNNTYVDYSYLITNGPPPVKQINLNAVAIDGTVDDTDPQINVNFSLTNSGETASFPQYYNIVVKNAQNTIVHSQQSTVWINFSPGQTSSQPVTLNLSAPLQSGTYQVSVSCSSSCYTTPSSKSTSFTVVPTQYTLTGVVKGEDGPPITKGKLFLYQDLGAGNIKFIQKTVPYTGTSFSFPINTKPHTLYFIPDPVQYPDYVPTIYGKTVALQQSNFFTASANKNVNFEILKVNSPGTGTGIINGSVTGADPPSGAMQQQSIQPIAGVPVILISNTGQIVGVAYTDVSGSYQFKNLPRAIYQIMVSLELDNPSIMTPFSVDITGKNMNVDLVMKSDGTQTATSQFFLPQVITFSEFATYQYGEASITPNAQSDKGLTIEFISSDNSIANVINNEIIIKDVGTVVITARQGGDNFYLPASANRTLTITKANQTLTLSSLPAKKFGDGPFVVSSTSTAGLAPTLSSSNPAVASVSGSTITIHGVGTVEIIAEQPGNNHYNAAPTVREWLTIEKGIQSLALGSFDTKHYGDDPFLVETSSSSGLPVSLSSSDPTIASVSGNMITIHGAGIVEIIGEQPGNSLYNTAPLIRERLTIEKAPQRITFEELPEQDIKTSSFVLSATATSGLNVSFESSDEGIVSIVGNVAYVHKDGTVNITARQSGNQNYHAAGEIVRTQVVNVILGIEGVALSPQVFPNPTPGVLFFQIPGLDNVEVYDALGRIRKEAVWMNDKIDFSRAEPGVYLVKFFLKNQSVTARVIKQ